MSVLIVLLTFVINESDQFFSIAEQDDDLIGPAYANAIDGETLYMNGLEMNLFGIDAVERDQICYDRTGATYECGRAATLALQQLVQNTRVVCFPLVNINERRVLGLCELEDELNTDAEPMQPGNLISTYRSRSLSRIMIEKGHAIGIGVGAQIFADEQLQAQTLRTGIWQGSFVPPRMWRSTEGG